MNMPRILGLWVAASCSLSIGVHASPAPVSAMTWTDLRTAEPVVPAMRRLWADRLGRAERERAKTTPKAQPLPAYTLSQTFAGARPVLVSILFNLVDCELPGNGNGADLFARCPMRVLTGSAGASRMKQLDSVCYLAMPPIAKPDDGPDPAQNFTSVTLDAQRVLHLRVVQAGQPVPACDLDVPLE